MQCSCSVGLHAGIAFVTIIAWIPGHAATYLGQHSQIPGQAQDPLARLHLGSPKRPCSACTFQRLAKLHVICVSGGTAVH